MIDINDVIARIKDNIPELKLVGGAVQFQAAAERHPAAEPACFVLTNAELPGAPAAANLLVQRVLVDVGIVLVVRNVSDVTGAAASADMETLRTKVKDQLFGWLPPGVMAPLSRGPGNLLAYREGRVWWQDIYSTSYIDKAKQ